METKLQYQMCNGMWADCSENQASRMIAMLLEREPSVAERQGRKPITSQAEAMEIMATGEELQYDDDWYAYIRIKPKPVNVQRPAVDMVKCSCGHTVSRINVMSASLGTACPDCYDRMSK